VQISVENSAEAIGAQYQFFPVNMDIKQTEVVRTILIDNVRAGLTDEPRLGVIPVYLSTDPGLEEMFCQSPPAVAVFLDLHDTGRENIDLSRAIWAAVLRYRVRLLYLKLQIHDRNYYPRENHLPDLVHVLSLPLLPGGSRFHITALKDHEGDGLFRTMFNDNPLPDYVYDWSWIGGGTSEDRQAAFALFESVENEKCFCRMTQPGHSDAALANVPYADYIRISRQSRICLSLNGNGPWCLKDGEMFANHCFVLRQHHPALFVNPLSPTDGIHWKVSSTQELPSAIEYYLRHEEEREQIRDQGHSYLREVVFEAKWALAYLQRIDQYLVSGQKVALGEFLIA